MIPIFVLTCIAIPNAKMFRSDQVNRLKQQLGRRPTRDTMEKFGYSVKEFQGASGLGRNSVYSAIQRGEIPVWRIGRRLIIPRQAVEGMLNGCTPGLGHDTQQLSSDRLNSRQLDQPVRIGRKTIAIKSNSGDSNKG
jgi:excisionase family DNA binding protein